MKNKIIITLAFVACSAFSAMAQTNAIEKYFSNYLDDQRFNVVYISPKLFQMISKLDTKVLNMKDEGEAKAIMDMAKDMQGLRILTTDTTPGVFYKEAKAKINSKEYEVLMTVRDKDGDNVDFLIKETNNVINELLLLSGGKDEFLLMSFIGNLDLNKITNLAKQIDK